MKDTVIVDNVNNNIEYNNIATERFMEQISGNLKLYDFDYPDRYINGTLQNGYLRIGDTILPYSAQDVSIQTSNEIMSLPLLRTSSAQLFMNGKCEKVIRLTFFFNGLVDIIGHEEQVPFINNNGNLVHVKAPHPNTLRALIAQFRRMPFVPIECQELINHDITSIAMLQLDVETVPDYPYLMKCSLICVPFEHTNYLPGIQDYSEWICWPVWRWHWRNEWMNINQQRSGEAMTSPFPQYDYNSIDYEYRTKFHLVSEVALQERKMIREHMDMSDNEAYRITESDLSFTNQDHVNSMPEYPMDYDNLYTNSIRVSFTNEFSSIDICDKEHGSLQFMGGTNTEISIAGICTSGVTSELESMFKNNRDLIRKFHFEIISGFMAINNNLINMLGLKYIVPKDYSFTTLTGYPGWNTFNINLVQFNKEQSGQEQFARIQDIMTGMEYNKYNQITEWHLNEANKYAYKALSNTSLAAVNYMSDRLHEMAKINGPKSDTRTAGVYTDSGWIQSAHETMKTFELYPDLTLPPFEQFIEQLPAISEDYVKHGGKKLIEVTKSKATVSEDTVNSYFYYINKKKKEKKFNIQEIIKPLLLDPSLYDTGGRYVDPDFYLQRVNKNVILETMYDLAIDNAKKYIVDSTRNQYIGLIRLPNQDIADEYALSTIKIEDLVSAENDNRDIPSFEYLASKHSSFINSKEASESFHAGTMFGQNNMPDADKNNYEDIIGWEGLGYDEYQWQKVKEHITSTAKKKYYVDENKMTASMYEIELKANHSASMNIPIAYAIVNAHFGWDINRYKMSEVKNFLDLYEQNLNITMGNAGSRPQQEGILGEYGHWFGEKWQVIKRDLNIQSKSDELRDHIGAYYLTLYQLSVKWQEYDKKSSYSSAKQKELDKWFDSGWHYGPAPHNAPQMISSFPKSKDQPFGNIPQEDLDEMSLFADSNWLYETALTKSLKQETLEELSVSDEYNKIKNPEPYTKTTSSYVDEVNKLRTGKVYELTADSSSIMQRYNQMFGMPATFNVIAFLDAMTYAENLTTNYPPLYDLSELYIDSTFAEFVSKNVNSTPADNGKITYAFGPIQFVPHQAIADRKYLYPDEDLTSAIEDISNGKIKEKNKLDPEASVVYDKNSDKKRDLAIAKELSEEEIYYWYAVLMLLSEKNPAKNGNGNKEAALSLLGYDMNKKYNGQGMGPGKAGEDYGYGGDLNKTYVDYFIERWDEIQSTGSHRFGERTKYIMLAMHTIITNQTALTPHTYSDDNSTSLSPDDLPPNISKDEIAQLIGDMKIDDIIRYGSPMDYTSDFQKFWGSYVDYIKENPYGRLIGAFPSYSIMIINEDQRRWHYRLQPIFNKTAALMEMHITRHYDRPADVCRIRLSNAYRNLASYLGDQYMANIAWREPWYYTLWMGTGFIYDAANKFGLNSHKHEIYKRIYEQRNKSIHALMLRPGVRLHVRVGYGSNAYELPIAFNGTVTDISPPGDVCDIVALGDGIELEKKLPAYNPTANLEPSILGWEPRELICHMLMSGGITGGNEWMWDVLRNHLSAFTGGRWFGENPLGIVHFGNPLYFDPYAIDETTKQSRNVKDEDTVTWMGYLNKQGGTIQNYFDEQFTTPMEYFHAGYKKWLEVNNLKDDVIDTGQRSKKEKEADFKKAKDEYKEEYVKDYNAGVEARHNMMRTMSEICQFLTPGHKYSLYGRKNILEEHKSYYDNEYTSSEREYFKDSILYFLAKKNYFNPFNRKAYGEIGENVYSTTSYEEGEKSEVRQVPSVCGHLHWPDCGMNMYIFDKTPWDIIRLCADAKPNFVAAVRPFEFRSTLFFGQPYYEIRDKYKRINIDECIYNPELLPFYGVPIFYTSRKFSQVHIAHSSVNLSGNDLKATEDKMCNEVIARWFTDAESSGITPEKIMAERQTVSRHIYPERRKRYVVDTNFVGNHMERGWMEWLTGSIPGIGTLTYHGRAIVNYLNNYFYNIEKARMIARSVLRDYVREMYQGSIVTIGNARVWPHDKMYLNDNYNDMKGLTVVRKNTLHFSRDTGFINVTELAPYAYVKGDLKMLEQLMSHGYTAGALAARITAQHALYPVVRVGVNSIQKSIINALGWKMFNLVKGYNARAIYLDMMIQAEKAIVGLRSDMSVLNKFAGSGTDSINAFLAQEGYTLSQVDELEEFFFSATGWKRIGDLSEAEKIEQLALSLHTQGIKKDAIQTLTNRLATNVDDFADKGVFLKKIAETGKDAEYAMLTNKYITGNKTEIVKALGLAADEIEDVAAKTVIREKLLGRLSTALAESTFSRFAAKVILEGPFTMLGTYFGTGIGGPFGTAIGWFVGFLIDQLLFEIAIAIPTTYFMRYFDDEYSLEMSLLLHRGREFSAGINGHNMNKTSTKLYTPPGIDRYKVLEEDIKKKFEQTQRAIVKNENFFTQANAVLSNSNYSTSFDRGTINKKGYIYPIPSKFISTVSPYDGDDGCDIHAVQGTPVMCVRDGQVVYNDASGHSAWEGSGNDTGAIRIKHADGTEAWYAHLSGRNLDLKPGDFVKAGTPIGNVGTANNVPHLHISIFLSSGGDSGGYIGPFVLGKMFKELQQMNNNPLSANGYSK